MNLHQMMKTHFENKWRYNINKMKQKGKKCALCGDKFYPSNNQQSTCSMKCSFEHQNKKIKEKIKNKCKLN